MVALIKYNARSVLSGLALSVPLSKLLATFASPHRECSKAVAKYIAKLLILMG